MQYFNFLPDFLPLPDFSGFVYKMSNSCCGFQVKDNPGYENSASDEDFAAKQHLNNSIR